MSFRQDRDSLIIFKLTQDNNPNQKNLVLISMVSFLFILVSFLMISISQGTYLTGIAKLTHYNSYPACCDFQRTQNFNWKWGKNCWYASGCDYKGGDIRHHKTSDEQCSSICAQNPHCTHFSWTNLNGGTCYLKILNPSAHAIHNTHYGKAAICGSNQRECRHFSGCKYKGTFSCINRKLTYWQVRDASIVAFYDNSDPNGHNFRRKYCGKNIKLSFGSHVVFAKIQDTCGNHDCKNCCARNSHPSSGYLVDMEAHTAIRLLGNVNKAHGEVHFEIYD